MKHMKLSLRLWCLSGLLIAVISVIAIVNHVKASQLMDSLGNVSEVQMPAVRSMTLVDMMHDGLRAVVMRSYVAANEKDSEAMKESAEEVEEFSKKISENIQTIEKLDIAPETKKLISAAKPDLDVYVKESKDLVKLASMGNMDEFRKRLPIFSKAFKNLEGKLEVLGEKIEADADKIHDDGKDILRVSATIASGGVALAIVMTFFLVRSLVAQFSSVTESIASSSVVVDEVARHLESTSQRLSSSSTQQSAALQETAAGIEETTAMIGKNANNAQRSSELSGQSTETVARGKHVLGELVHSIDEIASSNDDIMKQIQESNTEISTVINVIREIGNKTKVINDIVFQTKLLSFNASVEAARAGEQGKGFAVVAQEVGNLAAMSGNSAQEITDLLDQSIRKVESIVNQTNEKVQSLVRLGTSKIESGTKMARQCEEVFNEIVEHTSQVGGIVGEIADASREQSRGIDEINKAVSEIDQASQQNNAISQEAAQSAADLKEQVRHLKGMINELSLIVRGVGNSDSDKIPRAS